MVNFEKTTDYGIDSKIAIQRTLFDFLNHSKKDLLQWILNQSDNAAVLLIEVATYNRPYVIQEFNDIYQELFLTDEHEKFKNRQVEEIRVIHGIDIISFNRKNGDWIMTIREIKGN